MGSSVLDMEVLGDFLDSDHDNDYLPWSNQIHIIVISCINSDLHRTRKMLYQESIPLLGCTLQASCAHCWFYQTINFAGRRISPQGGWFLAIKKPHRDLIFFFRINPRNPFVVASAFFRALGSFVFKPLLCLYPHGFYLPDHIIIL